MLLPSLRLILALTTLALGILLIVHASKSRYRQKDPALVLIIIATLAELALLCLEIAYLGFSLAKVPSPNFFPYISEWAFMVLALAYLYVTYQHWLVNGLKLTGYIPFQFFVGASLINLGIFALQFLFPDLSKEIHIINQIILSAIILYAGICAVIARSKKVDFYPATRGAFWMALFCIIYGPLVGLPDMFALAVPGLDPNRPVALQLFPFRELLILAIYASHMEPFYTHLWKNLGTTKALSPREGEVYKLLQQGLSNADIALELHISLATVKSHVRQVLRKQGVESRADLTEEQKS